MDAIFCTRGFVFVFLVVQVVDRIGLKYRRCVLTDGFFVCLM